MEVHPHWDTEPEQMGTKDKFWFRDPDDPLNVTGCSSFRPRIRAGIGRRRSPMRLPARCVSWHRESSYHSIA